MEMQEMQELLALARNKSTEARGELTTRLLTLFAESQVNKDINERSLMFDILRSILGDIEGEIRKDLSAALADAEDAPNYLIRKLASEDVAIAMPILQRSLVLYDDDLLDVIATCSREHSLTIAGRDKLSAFVSDELAMSDDDGVIRKLLENASAEIASLTMNFLVSEARSMEGIQEPLARREDLGRDQALRLAGHVSDSLKEYLSGEWRLTDAEIAALQSTADQSRLNMIDRMHDYWQAAEDLVEGLHRHGSLSPTLVAATLRSGHVALFLAQIRHMSGLNRRMIQRVIMEPFGLGFAVLAKHTGFSRAEFADMFRYTTRGRGLAADAVEQEMQSAMEAFDAIDGETAALVIGGWQKGQGYLRSLKEHHALKVTGAKDTGAKDTGAGAA